VTANPSQVLRNPLYHSLRFATQMFRFWVNSHLSKQKRIKPHKKYTKKQLNLKKIKNSNKKITKNTKPKNTKNTWTWPPFLYLSPPVSLLTQPFLSFSYLLYLLNWIHQSNPLFQTSITILFNIKTNKTSNMKEDHHTTINTSTPTKNKNKSKKNNKTKTYYFMSFFFSFLSFSPLDCFYFFVVCFILCCFLFPFQQQSFFLFFPLSFFLL